MSIARKELEASDTTEEGFVPEEVEIEEEVTEEPDSDEVLARVAEAERTDQETSDESNEDTAPVREASTKEGTR